MLPTGFVYLYKTKVGWVSKDDNSSYSQSHVRVIVQEFNCFSRFFSTIESIRKLVHLKVSACFRQNKVIRSSR